MTSREIRSQFIDFFVKKHRHTFVASSPVVPLDDPTLLFANAGMNQFKPYFLGTSKAPWPRVANTQKCIRAGGKHNDLDDVGRSRRHHTFFEMLGNWSFGDYFKQGAIEMAWELLTQVWKLDPSRLHVTVYRGDPADGVPPDDEAARLWETVAGVKPDHIHRFVHENFWEMGDTGPCGPCTEIFIDRTPDGTGGPQVNGTDPRVMEIWNLVFIQYNRGAGRKLTPLPAQHVDTGMGLERICQVIGGFSDNYATDLFTPIFSAISDLSGLGYGGKFPTLDQAGGEEAGNLSLSRDIAFRVVADHIRCLTFALTDGAIPSNEGRGYVLRRILRRAVRFGRQTLELREPFLHRLVPVVVDAMGDAFPEIKAHPDAVAKLIQNEEESFSRTLDRGLELFAAAADEARKVPTAGTRPVVSAANAFKLHDTYGFPIDLTQIIAREQDLDVDVPGYEKLMDAARDKARLAGRSGQENLAGLPNNILTELAAMRVHSTDDQAKFLHKPLRAHVAAIWDGTHLCDHAGGSGKVALLLDKTNFYAEMGGQVGDQGEIRTDHGGVFVVETTQVNAGFVLHIGHIKTGKLTVGDSVTAEVFSARQRTEKNHTSTHLLNWALRQVLGDHVQQKGSLVDAQKLRFDFIQPVPVSDDQLAHVESLVAKAIEADMPVYTAVVPAEKGRDIFSLRAIFGEKYPPMVRVVSIGRPVEDLLADPANPNWRQYSIEFCGGTHLAHTGQAEAFVLIGEESVSKGVRRVVALTGQAARDAQRQAGNVMTLVDKAAHAPVSELPALLAEIQKVAREPGLPMMARRLALHTQAAVQEKLKQEQKKHAGGNTDGHDFSSDVDRLVSTIQTIGPAKLIVGQLSTGDPDALRSVMDSLKKKLGQDSMAMLLVGTHIQTDKDGKAQPPKVNLLASVSDALIDKLKAGDWVKHIAPLVGGSGGGRPQLAMAGGKDVAGIERALETGRDFAVGKLA